MLSLMGISRPRIIVIMAAAASSAAAWLKGYYSRAGSDDLGWILWPTVQFSEILTGMTFSRRSGEGWIDADQAFAVVSQCSGVNFLIICFCMLSFQLLAASWKGRLHPGWVLAALPASWLYTVFANGIRIWLSIRFYQADIYEGGLTPEGVHRAVGIAVYYLLLFAGFHLASHVLCKAGSGKCATGCPWLSLIPLFWYIMISLGVPLLNNAYRIHQDRFLEHALAVGGVSLAITLFFVVSRLLFAFSGRRTGS